MTLHHRSEVLVLVPASTLDFSKLLNLLDFGTLPCHGLLLVHCRNSAWVLDAISAKRSLREAFAVGVDRRTSLVEICGVLSRIVV